MKRKMIEIFKKAQGGIVESGDNAKLNEAMKNIGDDVVFMAWADPFMPDKSMPEHVEKALIDSITGNMAAHYTSPIGYDPLKERLVEKLKRKNGLDVKPHNILITPGSDNGLYYAILPFVEDGDEVIIPCPSYPNNAFNVEIMGGKVVPVELKEELNYQIVKEDLESKITDKTKMIILTNPNNPTTTIFNRDSLNIIRDLSIKKDLIVVVDQAFEDYTYENEFISLASMPDMFERTVSVFSFSKGMGLSGLRVAYIVASDEIMDSMYANAVCVIGAASTSSQHALCAALDDSSFMKDYEAIFDERRHLAYEILKEVPNVSLSLPESGFLCWVNVSKLGSSTDVMQYLLEEAKVLVNDGAGYGLYADGHLRIVLGVFKDTEIIRQSLLRIKDALIKYQNR